jgi:hypothetical protein
MTVATSTKAEIKVADEAWIATALLHREHPDQPDFAIDEIVARARQESVATPLRPGVYIHVVQHCVANRPPNPGRYRMLFESGPGRRRLFRKGDPYDPAREGSKVTPSPHELPEGYRGLLDWYRRWSGPGSGSPPPAADPLLALRGSGRQLWSDEHADDYVQRLRESW